jgi:capsular exopolysaccharide synthesis family protein
MSQYFKALEKAEREERERRRPAENAAPPAADDAVEASTSLGLPRPEAATTVPPPQPEVATAATAPAAPLPSRVLPLEPPVVTPWPRPQTARRAARAIERAERKPSKKSWTKLTRSRDSAPMLVVDREPNSVATEAYRALRVNIEFMLQGQKCRNVVITSPSQGEGKSTTAANLAIVSAQAGWRVCLVEADVRRPVLHTAFGLPNRDGLAKALTEELPLSTVALPTDFPGLSVVVAGDYDPGQTDFFSSSRIQQVRQDIESHYDLVLWDTPPVMQVADALNLVAQCDGVILVVRSGAIPYNALRRAGRQIAQVKGKILGVLLNSIDLRRTDEEIYGDYHPYPRSDRDTQL